MIDNTPLIEAKAVRKTFGSGSTEVQALRAVDMAVEPGTFVIIRGRSGSGKTTLLNLLAGLDEPTSGSILLDGQSISELSEYERAHTRRTEIGFVFQAFGLLPILTAAENVEVPLRLIKSDPAERRDRAKTLLDLVGLGERGHHRPHELSGGEQQRVAIARALANHPRILLADEPTGQLDSHTGLEIVGLLSSLVHSEGIAAIIASHDEDHLALADQIHELHDGAIVNHGRS